MWLIGVRLTRLFRWRSPRSTAKLLLKLAKAERSSFYDLMEAANQTTEPARRALYLRHATDDQRHAAIFRLRALELEPSLATDPSAFEVDFEHLFSTLGEERFLGLVHRGERRGRAQLTRYRDELTGDVKTCALLDAILKDEAHHESYTEQLSTPAARRWAWSWEARRTWRRLGARPSSALFTLSMWLVFGVLTPFSWLARMLSWATNRRPSGWRAP